MNRTKQKTVQELRRFGVTMSVPFSIIGGVLLWKGSAAAPWLFGVAGAFLAAGLLVPRALGPVERGWMAFAHRLSIVTTFVLLTVTFYMVITPFGIVCRLFGRDRLHLRPDPNQVSYWIPVEVDGPGTRYHTPY